MSATSANVLHTSSKDQSRKEKFVAKVIDESMEAIKNKRDKLAVTPVSFDKERRDLNMGDNPPESFYVDPAEIRKNKSSFFPSIEKFLGS